ncbi:MAG: hypothetical protein AAF620_16665 [Bacteroidota bacterium]
MSSVATMLYESLTYSKKVREGNYFFEMEEWTKLGAKTVRSKYSQHLNIYMNTRSMDGYEFSCTVSDLNFEMDKTLAKQKVMLLELSELTQHLEIALNPEANIIDLINYKKIWKKWERLKTKMKQRNQGALAHGYIDAVSKKLDDKSKFLQDIQQYRMLGLIFNGLQGKFFNGRHKLVRARTYQNMIHCLPLHVEETVQQTSHLIETAPFQFEMTGVLKPIAETPKSRMKKYFQYYLINGNALALDKYDGTYTINPATGWINEARLSILLSNHAGYEREFYYHLKLENHG